MYWHQAVRELHRRRQRMHLRCLLLSGQTAVDPIDSDVPNTDWPVAGNIRDLTGPCHLRSPGLARTNGEVGRARQWR